MNKSTWPTIKQFDQDHLARIAMPIGGIGTGTVSLGGRGNLKDWELMNRPAKGFIPAGRLGSDAPFFALYAKPAGGDSVTRVLEGPLERVEYEGQMGSTAPNHGLPRFKTCTFSAAYPFGQVHLFDPNVPLTVRLEAFNPLVPCDPDKSGIPVAVLRYVFTNRTGKNVTASVCGSLQNFIGNDGTDDISRANRNRFRNGKAVQGIRMESRGVDPQAPQWGTLALTTPAKTGVTHRTAWISSRWGTSILDFWDDFSQDGRLENRRPEGEDSPMGSLAVRFRLAPGSTLPQPHHLESP